MRASTSPCSTASSPCRRYRAVSRHGSARSQSTSARSATVACRTAEGSPASLRTTRQSGSIRQARSESLGRSITLPGSGSRPLCRARGMNTSANSSMIAVGSGSGDLGGHRRIRGDRRPHVPQVLRSLVNHPLSPESRAAGTHERPARRVGGCAIHDVAECSDSLAEPVQPIARGWPHVVRPARRLPRLEHGSDPALDAAEMVHHRADRRPAGRGDGCARVEIPPPPRRRHGTRAQSRDRSPYPHPAASGKRV